MSNQNFSFYDRARLPSDKIFVFGSNLSGIHGLGAAKTARFYYGAVLGQGVGRVGQSYAIPTKEQNKYGELVIMDHTDIVPYIHEFCNYTWETEELFYVTPVGCGLAGFEPEDMATHFSTARNCEFPRSFEKYLSRI